ncbi:MAG: ABC transporter ATP-binding protein [Alphaproteobacteria bacterium]|nr:ABC transporter ATP-binding protein [Alphaproteobacteria bacterium]
MDSAGDIAIRVRGLTVRFGRATILENLDLDVRQGETLGFVGPSGSGKSVLLRTIVGLVPHQVGTIEVLGTELDSASTKERERIEQRWGILFQNGALFSSLTVAQNIEVPLKEHTKLSRGLIDELSALKIGLVGLAPEAADKYPSQLSGGMKKRAGLARALALDPEILFLDEPTAGLDPIGAAAFDQLILSLHWNLHLTVFMVTHDLDSLMTICDRIAVLGKKRVIAIGTVDELLRHDDPWIREYFHGPRGRAASAAE